MQGTVKWFNAQKGYGFIIAPDGKDIFVHHSNIKMDGFRHLDENDIVSFELGTGEGGREQAINVQSILTMKMIRKSLKEENLYVKGIKSNKNTITMNSLGMSKGYMVVDQNDVIQTGENGMTFMDLAEYAGFKIVQASA